MAQNYTETEYIDLDQVASELGLNKERLFKAIREGELAAVKEVWREHRTTRAWVQSWLDKNTVNAEQGEK